MLINDMARIREIADVLESDRDAAFRLAGDLDTECRERIPGDVWEFLGGTLING
jgi:hypothetical protein